MANKLYCKVVIFEGDEARLRSAYSRELQTGGTTRLADGIRYSVVQVSYRDLMRMNSAGVQRILKESKQLAEVGLEDVPEEEAKGDSE